MFPVPRSKCQSLSSLFKFVNSIPVNYKEKVDRIFFASSVLNLPLEMGKA